MRLFGALLLALLALTAQAHAAFPGDNGRIVWSAGGDLHTTSGPLTATPDVEEAQATWSPDGTRVAFRVGTPGGSQPLRIATMNADGSDRRLIGGSERHETQPAWSADGRSIVFRRAIVGSATSGDVWLMGADGSNPRALVLSGPTSAIPLRRPTGRGSRTRAPRTATWRSSSRRPTGRAPSR
jgi:dipeptidyl aminopeptidase/acylaminoacyl peptidase